MAVFGDTLRQARAHKGVTLKEAESTTRISRYHLLALEEEKFEDLPPLIYQRGIVRNYAAYLDLDPQRVIALFDETRGVSPNDKGPAIPQPPLDMPNHWAPNFAIIAFLVVMSAIVFAWMYSAYFAPEDPQSTPTEVIPTVTPVNSDTLFLPSPSVVIPTATPEPTATATLEAALPTSIPEPTATVEPIVAADDAAIEESTEVATETATAEATETPAADLYLNFYASADITSLQIVADGVLVWDGGLLAGEKTGFMSAAAFEVYVAEPANLQVIEESGDAVNMGDTSFFRLP